MKVCYVLSGVCLFSLVFFGASNVSASSVSITVENDPSTLQLIPKASGEVFGETSPVTVKVTTDSSSGYTLTAAGPDDNRKLVGTTNSSNKLSSITSTTGITSTSFNVNEWGFKYCKTSTDANCMATTNYIQAPGSSTANQIQLDKTTSANSTTPVTYALAIGIKANASTPKDTYTTTFTLAATTNSIDYLVAYADATSSWPEPTSGNTTGSSIILSSITPTKDSYEFRGWCSVRTTDETCSGTVYQPGDVYYLGNGANVALYAMWYIDCSIMQNVSECKSKLLSGTLSAVGSTVTMVDVRNGGTAYTVGKLADGNIWMLENLNLGSTSTIALTPSDTNIASNWSLPASSSTIDSYTIAQINSSYRNTSDSYGKYGVYYNYCAASANTYCAAAGDAISPGPSFDICPKGWRMPTGSSGGEYGLLYTAITGSTCNYGCTTGYSGFRTTLKLPLTGYFSGSSATSQGSYSYFWSSTYYDGKNVYIMSLGESKISTHTSAQRVLGNPVRCIAK